VMPIGGAVVPAVVVTLSHSVGNGPFMESAGGRTW
jgi:predicted dienelactone hydrolase